MNTLKIELTEAQFQKQVTDLAELHGWETMHIVRCPTNRGDAWRTAAIGSLGRGWPDLVLIRNGTLVFAELKAEKGRLTADQQRVLGLLRGLEVGQDVPFYFATHVVVWRPSDWSIIEEVLANV